MLRFTRILRNREIEKFWEKLLIKGSFYDFGIFFPTIAAGKIIDILPTAFLAFMFILSQLKQHYY